jgi:TonB family protein
MKYTLLITLLLFASIGLIKAQSKSSDTPELETPSLKQLDVPTKDITFDAKNTDNKEQVFTSVDVEPRFQGGIANFYAYLHQNLVYPKNAIKQRKEGKVFIAFIVEKDGSLTNIKILRSVSPEIDAEAGRVVGSSPKWLPALQNEKPVRYQYTFPIAFKLPPENVIKQQLLADSLGYDPNKVFSAVEREPSFVGGMEKFYKFLEGIIRYPDVAKRYNVQGKVFITFVVEKDGSLTDIRVVRGVGSGCDEEAVRVMARSPKWNPGMQNGRPVRVQYIMPISFSLVSQ